MNPCGKKQGGNTRVATWALLHLNLYLLPIIPKNQNIHTTVDARDLETYIFLTSKIKYVTDGLLNLPTYPMRIIRLFCMRWRLLRLLLALLLLVSLTAAYIFLKSRPSYALYRALDLAEVALSQDLIRQTSGKRYVLFKQLRGAGFNNQVSSFVAHCITR